MKYEVVKAFRDKHSRERPKKKYDIGYFFETNSKERAVELQKQGYLAETKEEQSQTPTEIKSLGGGYYELPNGEKVRGKAAAEKALEGLSDEAEGS